MLIVTRRPGQKIMIGDNVTVVFCGWENGHARIAVDAPKEIPVHRREVYDRIQLERAAVPVVRNEI